jgi:8-oxo-dGTP pyrophosphatase MutT (NUDIX family)
MRSVSAFTLGLITGCMLVSIRVWFATRAHPLKGPALAVETAAVPDSLDPFPEPRWHTANTLAARTVVSTAFARFEVHRVIRPDGSVASDWLWTDERAHVNILVHLKVENKYLLFLQSKYGLESERFATVGGLFNRGENASACATRELLEETGLKAEQLVPLGPPQGLRVQADRGGGLLYPFLARNCVLSSKQPALKSDDYERQRVRKLSLAELEAVLLSGGGGRGIGEAQWLATAALGVLHERGLLT